MFEQKLVSFQELPVRESYRRCTDIFCTIVSSIFAISLFIISLCLLNKKNFYLTNFPTDSDNIPCSIGLNEGFAYIYLPDLNEIDNRVCVSTCPTQNSLSLLCRPNSKITNCLSVYIYGSTASNSRLPGFCIPDEESANQAFELKLGLNKKWNYLRIYDIVRIGLLISLGVGFLYLVFVQLSGRFGAGIMFSLTGLICLAIAVLAVFTSSGWRNIGTVRVLLSLFFICLTVYFWSNLCFYSKRIKIAGIFLSHASAYTKKHFGKLFWIIFFLGLTIGLIVLIMFQYLAFSSSAKPVPSDKDIYLHCVGNHLQTILCIIQFFWGLQFLRDAFNFIISGNASEWYVREGKLNNIVRTSRKRIGTHGQNCCIPVARLLCTNWGSVVGGSFLNAFLKPINFLFQIFRCYPDGACPIFASHSSFFSYVCCNNLCDLVRTDAYTYINLAGIPYCNASRNCQALISNSDLFIGSQSVTYFYRNCAHLFCIGLSTIIGYLLINSSLENGLEMKQQFIYHPDIGTIVVIISLSYCVTTYFTDFHTNIAESFQISYLIENSFSDNNDEKIENVSQLRNQLNNISLAEKDWE